MSVLRGGSGCSFICLLMFLSYFISDIGVANELQDFNQDTLKSVKTKELQFEYCKTFNYIHYHLRSKNCLLKPKIENKTPISFYKYDRVTSKFKNRVPYLSYYEINANNSAINIEFEIKTEFSYFLNFGKNNLRHQNKIEVINLVSNNEIITKLDSFESVDINFDDNQESGAEYNSVFILKDNFYGDVSYSQTFTSSGVLGISLQLKYLPIHIILSKNNLIQSSKISFISGIYAGVDFNIINIEEKDLSTIIAGAGIGTKILVSIPTKEQKYSFNMSPWLNTSIGACIYPEFSVINPCLKLELGLEIGNNDIAFTVGANQIYTYNSIDGITHIYPLGIKLGLVLPIGH